MLMDSALRTAQRHRRSLTGPGVVIEAIALNLLEGKSHQGNPLWNFRR